MHQLPTIRQAARGIADGNLSPVELVKACLENIRRNEDRIHAWVLVDEDGAMREAERLAQLARQGQTVGPLHGVAIGVKDIIDVCGMPTRAGSPLRQQTEPAETDAPVVARLRKAGAIVLGKTVTTEWACFDPSPTRNPWNLAHTPGGSSSGSAAALAAQMCMGALGTQTGGSIIRPAAYCGVYGLKPTFARLAADDLMNGICPVSSHLDHVGPLARSVEDLRILSEIMLGESMTEPGSGNDLTEVSLCYVSEFFESLCDAELAAQCRQVLGNLPRGLITEEQWPFPARLSEVHANHYRIMAVEAAQVHHDAFATTPESFGPKVAGLIQAGQQISQTDYEAALAHQQQFQKDLLSCFTKSRILAMPATPTAAPRDLTTTGDAKCNSPFSYAGFPALTLPCGLTEQGLPIGLQLVGAPNTEAELLSLAAKVEQHIDFVHSPSLLKDQC